MLRLAVNPATGALPDAVLEPIARWLGAEDAGATLPDEALPPAWERRRVLDLLAEALPSRLDARLAPFLKGLRRRLSRDQERLHAYHDDLHREAMRRSLRAAGGRPGRAGARSNAARRSGANTAPRSTIWPASMRCGSRSLGCRHWS